MAISGCAIHNYLIYRKITITMTRTGFKANETTNTPSFKLAFVESNACRRGQYAKFTSIASNAETKFLFGFVDRSYA